MRGFTFSDSLVLAACLHGLTFFVLSPPSQRIQTPPPPPMLHIKLGTNFGNAKNAPPVEKKTVVAAIPQPLKQAVKPEWVSHPKTLEKQPVTVAKVEALAEKRKPLLNEQPLFAPTVKPEPLSTLEPAANIPLPAVPEQKPIVQAALTQQASSMGSPLGNSLANGAGHIMRYEQLLAVWLHKFKQYPAEARMKNQEGTAVLHLVISRAGNILRSDLSTKTGFPLLDEAVMEMVVQAKTVPPVPDDYPGESELEFQIPVKFTLESL